MEIFEFIKWTPILLPYGTSTLLLTQLYRKKFKLWFSFVFALALGMFSSSFWELSSWFLSKYYNSSTIFIYLEEGGKIFLFQFLPFFFFLGLFGIKIKLSKWKVLAVVLAQLIVAGQILYVGVYTYFNSMILSFPNNPFEWCYMIDRIVNLFALSWFFYPNIVRTRFGICNAHSRSVDY